MTSDLSSRYVMIRKRSQIAIILIGCFVFLPSLNRIPQKYSILSELVGDVYGGRVSERKESVLDKSIGTVTVLYTRGYPDVSAASMVACCTDTVSTYLR